MTRKWLRFVTPLAVGLLLVLATLAPWRRAGARPTWAPAAPATVYSDCNLIVQSGGTGSTIGIGNGGGVTQPVIADTNLSYSSINVVAGVWGSSAIMTMIEWDPLALAADPTTIALRTQGFGGSAMLYSQMSATWSPPIVAVSIPQVAEPPRNTVAMDFYAYDLASTLGIYFQPDGAAVFPRALIYANGTARVPLPGTHPLLWHAICDGDSTLQDLRIVQSVRTTNALIDTSAYELLQRFRVPSEIQLRWVEFAFGHNRPTQIGHLSIVDAQGVDSPPLTLPLELVGADFGASYGYSDVWASHFDFDRVITLEPDHDYWLLARTVHSYALHGRMRDGHESPDFVAEMGPLYSRTDRANAWSEIAGTTLCFKLIGQPTGFLDVPRPTPGAATLALAAGPNPTRDATRVRWTGATGSVRFEVLDARGRRVASGGGAGGASGDWTWRAGALPAGVYFVRATDGAGRRAVERVVLVR